MAREYGGAAPQNESSLELMRDPSLPDISDDCLYLNIVTPSCDDRARPVLFWVHGGAFNTGSGANGLYRSSSLAKSGDCVLVTINYRLGPLGFLRLQQATDGKIPSVGNEGLQDQVAALRWVHQNIARFGGDPDNICLFGESAGGMSVASLLAMPAAQGMFRRAIVQSGGADIAISAERGDAMGAQFLYHLKEAGHSTDNLADLDWRVLTEASTKLRHPELIDRSSIMGMSTVPVIDGEHLPDLPLEAVRRGQLKDIDLLVSWTRDEWNLFAAYDPNQWQLPEMRLYKQMDQLAGSAEKARQLIAASELMLSRRQRPTHPGAVFSQAMTDYAFRLPAYDLLNAWQEAGGSALACCFGWESPLADGVLGACHALELPFVFGTLHPKGIRAWAGEGEAVQALSALMQDCWNQFARTGKIALQGEDWPLWNPTAPLTGNFGKDNMVASGANGPAQFSPPLDRDSLEVWQGIN